MRRSLIRRAASLIATTLVAAVLLTTPAWAGDGFGSTTSSSQGASQQGNGYVPQVIVTVTVNGVRETGVAAAPGSTTYVHPPCWREPSWTGPERAQYYDSGNASRDARHQGIPELANKPAGYADHKDEGPDKGMFWSAMCSSEYWTGDIHSFLDYSSAWIDSHPTIWVAVGDPNPNRDIVIPPAVLMEIARGLLKPSAPTLEVNPRTDSVVNLPTWVWATDDSFVEIRVRAELNGNWAEVIATPVGLRLSTNGPADVNSACADGGTPWKPGAQDTDCSVTFRRSTAGGGAYTISASIDWQVHWEGSGGENAALPPPPNAPIGDRDVQVDEVQTVVNGQPTPRQ